MRREAALLAVSFILTLCAAPCLALNPDEVALVAPAAERGSAASQVLLAVAYLHGDGGLAREPAKAAYWFEQAAIQGNVYAQDRLGDLYEQGLGVPANPKLAFDWRLKAANRGQVQAQVKVGKMYQEGVGVGKDIDQALYWFRRAATEGNAEAQFLLGRLYHYGGDVEVDRAAARSWLEQAAQKGYESAVLLLNMIESIGYQIDEGWYKRTPGLKQLADDGDLEAQYQLAQRYERGIGGFKKDAQTALGWYERAASGGHPMGVVARITLKTRLPQPQCGLCRHC
jgi:TPR repeat protein